MSQFINPLKTKWYVSFFVFLGWGLSFTMPILLPIDISSSLYDNCLQQENRFCEKPWTYVDHNTLRVVWNFLYWGTTVLCWTAIPFLQSYCSAGDFHIIERVKTSLRENIIFYLVVGAVCGVFLVMFLIWNKNGDWLGIAIAASNAWGLVMLIGMMGYGVVAVPLKTLKNISETHHVRTLQTGIYDLTEEHEEGELIYSELISLVKRADIDISQTDPIRKCVNTIISEINPTRYAKTEPARSFIKNYDSLSELHANVVFQQLKVKQLFYLLHSKVDRALLYEHIHEKSTSFFTKFYHQILKKIISITALVIFVFYSVIIFCSEITLPFNEHVLSPVYYIVHSIEASPILLFLAINVLIMYIAWCVYQTLMSMKLFDYYQLIDNRLSDNSSILFSASYLCRLCAPLALNFLHLIKFDGNHHNATKTAFQVVMSSMEDIPFFGQNSFNDYFPVVVIMVVLFAISNHFFDIPTVFDWILNLFTEHKSTKLTAKQKAKRGHYITQIFYSRYANYMLSLQKEYVVDTMKEKGD
ncbi:LMBR1 family region protein [Entamoeba marina]